MLRTLVDISDVPSAWIFEHYCKLGFRLHGQDVKILSMFNPKDSKPSMAIYYSGETNDYAFKDFSSGKGGDAIKLVQELYGLTWKEAQFKIDADYAKRNEEYEEIEIKAVAKYKVADFTVRKWNVLDVEFWTQFNIGSRLLGEYEVKPLKDYKLIKEVDGVLSELHFTGQHIYGYFKKNGDLHKIYRPKNPDFKFYTVTPYIQGSEQLTYSQSTLIICSSLKDTMSLRSLDLSVESVAPPSENTMLPKSVLSAYALKYKRILTLFDNDTAGKLAMNKYESMFNIPGVYLKLSKDLSDSIRDFGPTKVRQILNPLIKNT